MGTGPKPQYLSPKTRDSERPKAGLILPEICRLTYQTFAVYKVRFALTALMMMIGTASLILVVTIALTGKQYILHQIESIGANMIEAYYEGNANLRSAQSDFLTFEDVRAVRQEVPQVQFASPMIEIHTAMNVGGGKQREIIALGVSPEYRFIRNLELLAGRYFDNEDAQARNKSALMTEKLAVKLYGNADAAIGREIKLASLPFVVVGTFRERVETFGQTEISDDTILMPDTVARYFSSDDRIKDAFFSVADTGQVEQATEQIHSVLQSRHRPGSVYRVENLTELLAVAAKTANALTIVLLLISTVTLVVSGVGIMNIMLASIHSRIREIGVRKALGATKREIRYQFLAEATVISLTGGLTGILAGLSIPLSLRWIFGLRIPIAGISAVIAILVSSAIGLLFGTAPAARAANLDPVQSLHYE